MSSYLLLFCLIEIISFLTLLSRITRKLIVAVGLLCWLLFLFRKAILLNTCVIMLRSLFLYVIQCENKNTIFSFNKLNYLSVYTQNRRCRRRCRCHRWSEILPRRIKFSNICTYTEIIWRYRGGNTHSIYALLSFTLQP